MVTTQGQHLNPWGLESVLEAPDVCIFSLRVLAHKSQAQSHLTDLTRSHYHSLRGNRFFASAEFGDSSCIRIWSIFSKTSWRSVCASNNLLEVLRSSAAYWHLYHFAKGMLQCCEYRKQGSLFSLCSAKNSCAYRLMV